MSTSTEQVKTKVNYKMVSLNDSRIQHLIGDLENESSLEIKKKSEWLLKHYRDLVAISANSAKQQLPVYHQGGTLHAIGTLFINTNPQAVLDALNMYSEMHTGSKDTHTDVVQESNGSHVGSALGCSVGSSKESNIYTSVNTPIGKGSSLGSEGGMVLTHVDVTHQTNIHLLKNEILEVTILTRALYRLVDERERQLLQYKYLENALLDYEVVQRMAISERQYYRTKKSAILNFAECMKKMGYWVVSFE
ncbi:hypothetical protein ABC382_00345 [Lysinibacillus sp. 1P01SD]|uniref:hypothetical protein n=1 Tax=Lysinibacillus sp. 1P01SD TaxID=3132285 RepID=UPI0039A2C288